MMTYEFWLNNSAWKQKRLKNETRYKTRLCFEGQIQIFCILDYEKEKKKKKNIRSILYKNLCRKSILYISISNKDISWSVQNKNLRRHIWKLCEWNFENLPPSIKCRYFLDIARKIIFLTTDGNTLSIKYNFIWYL